MASIELKTRQNINQVNNTVEILDMAEIRPEQPPQHGEGHIQIGQFIKSFLYGGIDGIINTLCIIVSAVSSGESQHIIMAVGVAATIGDGLGMGLGDYLSFQAEQSYIISEKQRESYEIENMLQEELSEIEIIFKKIHYTPEQSKRLSRLFSQNKQIFVNVMMLYELGIIVSKTSAIQIGIVHFFSFVIFGILPVIPYIICGAILKSSINMLVPALMIGLAEFFILGIIKVKVIRQQGVIVLRSIFEIVIFASIIVVISYGLGFIFK